MKNSILQSISLPRLLFAGIFIVILGVIIFNTKTSEKKHDTDPEVANKQKMATYAYAILDKYYDKDMLTEPGDINVPEYDRLYISIINKGVLRCCMSGGINLDEKNHLPLNIESAVKKCINDKRYGGTLRKEEAPEADVVFDFFYNKRKLPSNSLGTLNKEIELGIHAIKVSKDGESAYFKASVPISKNYDLEKTLERLCSKADLKKECYSDPETDIYIYDSMTFAADRDGNINDLYRYNQLVNESDIDNEMIKERITMAGDWFKKSVDLETGLLEYEYFPTQGSYSNGINHVRQMASNWATTEIQLFLGQQTMGDVVFKTLQHYSNNLVKAQTEDGNPYLFVKIDSDAKLAYSAFMMLTLINFPDYAERDETLKLLADGILSQQQEDGSYKTYFQSEKNSGQDFYPGEAMLALMRYAEISEDTKYLESVKKASPYYRDYWRQNKNTAFIPWHSQANLLLYKKTEDKEIAEFVFEMNDWLVENYQDLPREYPDKEGGFKSTPGNSSSAYLEGVNDAYTLAVLVGDEEHKEKYKKALRSGVRFILQMQYHDGNTFYLTRPERAIGGFRENLTRANIRNDYVQHAAHALIKAYNNNVFD
jgi:AMMECR1 domain-containing protein